MGVTIEHVDFTAYTGSGAVQRISLPSNFTSTPKLFRLVMSGATTDDDAVSESRQSEGWYDGTRSWVIAFRADSGGTTGDADCYGTTSADTVGAIIDQRSQVIDDYCQFEAWGTDGGVGYVDIEWNAGASSSSAAYRCRLTAYTGSDFQAEIGVEEVVAVSQSNGVEYDVSLSSGSTLHPAAMRFHSAFGLTLSTGDNYSANGVLGSGWAVSDQAATPSFQQFANGIHYETPSLTPDQGQTMFNSEESGGTARCLARGDEAGTSTSNMEWELTDTQAGQWSYTIRNDVSDLFVGWVAMDFGDVIPVGVGFYTQKGSSDVSGYDGTFQIDATAVDGSGTFEPQAVDWVASDFAATGYESGNLTGSVNPYCAISANHIRDGVSGSITTGSTINFAHRNNSTSRTTWNYYSDTQFIEVIQHNTGSTPPTIRWSATATLESYGIELTMTDVPANTTKVNSFIAFGVAPTTSPITATLAGSASLSSADIEGIGVVASTLAGSASVSADIGGLGVITSTLAGSASIAAPLSGLGVVTSTLPGTSSVAAALDGPGLLQATLAGTSSIAAPLVGIGVMSAALAGSATVSSAALGVVPSPITATLAGAASVSAAISATGVLSATMAGSASLAAAPDGLGVLSATLAGAASLSAPIVGFGVMSATLAGAATVSSANLIDSAAVGILPISATLAGGSSISAAIVGFGDLSAALAGSASLSASISAIGSLAATLPGSASLSAGIVGFGVLSAALPGAATISSANLIDSAAVGVQPITATLAGSSSVSAALSATGVLSAGLAGSASLSASLSGLGAMSAALPGSASISGAALTGGPSPLSATLAGASSVSSAALSGVGVLSATLSGSASLAAAVSGPAAISATLAGTSTITAAAAGQATLALLLERGFLYAVLRRDRTLYTPLLRTENIWTVVRRDRNLYGD